MRDPDRVLRAGDSVSFTQTECHQALCLGIERFVRDRIAGVADQKATGRYPWCENDIQGMLAEIGFCKLAGVPFDRTTHARAENGAFDTRLPNGLLVDVKWREGPPYFGDMITHANKAPYLQGRSDVVCALMHGRLPLQQNKLCDLEAHLGSNRRVEPGAWIKLREKIPVLAKRLLLRPTDSVVFTFRGWVWGDHAVQDKVWQPKLPEPGYLFEQRYLLRELPTGTMPERTPFEEVVRDRVDTTKMVDLGHL